MRESRASRPPRPALVAVLTMLALLSSGSSLPAKVDVQHDERADFSRYTSYSWSDGTPARRPGVQELIVAAVDRELAARGLQKVDDDASFVVHTHALVDKHTLEKLADPTYFKFWSGVNVFDPELMKKGTLVVDLQDAGSERIVWRGLATGTVDRSFEKIGRLIDREVAKMFSNFPTRKE